MHKISLFILSCFLFCVANQVNAEQINITSNPENVLVLENGSVWKTYHIEKFNENLDSSTALDLAFPSTPQTKGSLIVCATDELNGAYELLFLKRSDAFDSYEDFLKALPEQIQKAISFALIESDNPQVTYQIEFNPNTAPQLGFSSPFEYDVARLVVSDQAFYLLIASSNLRENIDYYFNSLHVWN